MLLTRNDDKKQGVVLSSGGADGAYAVGVLKALCEGASPATGRQPLNPSIFVGSSIGAFNAAFMVAHSGSHTEDDSTFAASGLQRLWLDQLTEQHSRCGNGAYRFRANPFDLLDPRCLLSNPRLALANLTEDGRFLTQDFLARAVGFVSSAQPIEERSLNLFNIGSFVSRERYLKLIERNIGFEKIRNSATALRVIATNWDAGVLEAFPNEAMTDEIGASMIAASGALPGFFSPVRIGGTAYVDAAVLGYTSLAPAIDAGADVLHVIYVDPDVKNIPISALESTAETLYRVFVIGWADNVDTAIDAVGRINNQVNAVEDIIRITNPPAETRNLLQNLLRLGSVRRLPLPSQRSLRLITVHRYHPQEDLFGPLGLLNFDRDRIEGLIERGFRDAVAHDCAEEKCVLR